MTRGRRAVRSSANRWENASICVRLPRHGFAVARAAMDAGGAEGCEAGLDTRPSHRRERSTGQANLRGVRSRRCAMPSPLSLLQEHTTLRCRSLDRLYLNAYIPELQRPDDGQALPRTRGHADRLAGPLPAQRSERVRRGPPCLRRGATTRPGSPSSGASARRTACGRCSRPRPSASCRASSRSAWPRSARPAGKAPDGRSTGAASRSASAA